MTATEVSDAAFLLEDATRDPVQAYGELLSLLTPLMFEVYGRMIHHGLPHSAKDVTEEVCLRLKEAGAPLTYRMRDTLEVVVTAAMTSPRSN